MNIYITLDYELFFGANSGSVEHCIIKPTQALLKIVDPYHIKLVFFVDVGYLVQLEKQKSDYPKLEEDYKKITQQIKYLAANGHGLELHIHPHWEDSFYNGSKWVFNTERYKLSDFKENDVIDIITRYNDTLKRVSGKAPKAFRAGGWSAQPFKSIKKGLEKNHVFIESSVFPKGYYSSDNQLFDFRNVSQFKTKYTFSENLTIEDTYGAFTEIPISSDKVSPFFFWKFAFKKLLKQRKNVSFGDGSAIALKNKEKFRLMTSYSHSVVSIDGYKASYIENAFNKYVRNTKSIDNFVLIGHPKAFTEYSLSKVEKFILKVKDEHSFVTF